MVLAHALGANHALWDATARHLAPRYRVLRYDLRGHGQSDAPIGAYSMIRLADDVACLMDVLEVPAAHFVGVSVGGMIGQTAAVRHPERLLSLTLVATVNRTPLDVHPMWHERIGQVEAHGMAGVADSTMQRWFSAAFRGAHPQEVARVREMLLATPVHGYVGTCQAIMAFDLAGAISRIHCPTLVVAGEEDLGRRRRWPARLPPPFPVPGSKSCLTPRILPISSRRTAFMPCWMLSLVMRLAAHSAMYPEANLGAQGRTRQNSGR